MCSECMLPAPDLSIRATDLQPCDVFGAGSKCASAACTNWICNRGIGKSYNCLSSCRHRFADNYCTPCGHKFDEDALAIEAPGWNPKQPAGERNRRPECHLCQNVASARPQDLPIDFDTGAEQNPAQTGRYLHKCFRCQRLVCNAKHCRHPETPGGYDLSPYCRECDSRTCALCGFHEALETDSEITARSQRFPPEPPAHPMVDACEKCDRYVCGRCSQGPYNRSSNSESPVFNGKSVVCVQCKPLEPPRRLLMALEKVNSVPPPMRSQRCVECFEPCGDYCRTCQYPLCVKDPQCRSPVNPLDCLHCYKQNSQLAKQTIPIIYLSSDGHLPCRTCGGPSRGQKCRKCRDPVCYRAPARWNYRSLGQELIVKTYRNKRNEPDVHPQARTYVTEFTCRSLLDNRYCRRCVVGISELDDATEVSSQFSDEIPPPVNAADLELAERERSLRQELILSENVAPEMVRLEKVFIANVKAQASALANEVVHRKRYLQDLAVHMTGAFVATPHRRSSRTTSQLIGFFPPAIRYRGPQRAGKTRARASVSELQALQQGHHPIRQIFNIWH